LIVSVLTPSYNQARWLVDNLQSVAAQTYPHLEHMVMDGGSSDESTAILRSNERPGLVWRSERDRGQSHALNNALAESSGEIIGWLNSDDAYFAPDVVAEVVRLFRERPDIDVVYGHAVLVNADGLVMQIIWAPPFSRRLLPLYNFVIQPTAFIRRSAISEVFVDESFHSAMDRELWLRLTSTSQFARLDRIIAIDRHQRGRKVYAQPEIAAEETRRLINRYDIPHGRLANLRRKALKIAFRIAGAALLPQVQPPYAFRARTDGRARQLMRQCLVPRRFMSMGVETPSASPPRPSLRP
jgi:glycosyltransferase involved in cell wall biosynthesis